MQIVFDFITGKLPLDDFLKEWYANTEIIDWVESLVDLETEFKPEWKESPYFVDLRTIHYSWKGSLRRYIEYERKRDEYYGKKADHFTPKWLRLLSPFGPIAAIVTLAYPDIKPTTYYKEESDFLCSVVPEYIDGEEVQEYIDNLLSQFPPSMGKTKRKASAKAALREHFHINKKYPYWAQDPEWPMGVNSPMEYVSRKSDGELVQFTFRDVDTGEYRIVEQLY